MGGISIYRSAGHCFQPEPAPALLLAGRVICFYAAKVIVPANLMFFLSALDSGTPPSGGSGCSGHGSGRPRQGLAWLARKTAGRWPHCCSSQERCSRCSDFERLPIRLFVGGGPLQYLATLGSSSRSRAGGSSISPPACRGGAAGRAQHSHLA